MRKFSANGFPVIVAILLTIYVAHAHRHTIFEGLRYLDKHVFGEALKDAHARLSFDEDWSRLPAARAEDFDYSWLAHRDEAGLLRIAHALGGRRDANEWSAYEASHQAGFKFYEVDIWQDDNGVLRCHHGPEAPPPLTTGSCTFERLLARRTPGQYIVLDIKTDFVTTGDAVMTALRAYDDAAPFVIFQLYAPDHLPIFATWAAALPLAGPIVTVYDSRRSLNHVHKGLQRIGVRAMTLPRERAPALTVRDDDVYILTHPVRHCDDLAVATRYAIGGLYVKSDFKCGG